MSDLQQFTQATTMQKLSDSWRVLALGRDVQRRADLALIRDRIRTLRSEPGSGNDLATRIRVDELEALDKQITARKEEA